MENLEEIPGKKDMRSLSEAELIAAFKEIGEPSFRAKQIHEWLWKKSATNFEMMTNISLKTREWLSQHFTINHIVEDTKQIDRKSVV